MLIIKYKVRNSYMCIVYLLNEYMKWYFFFACFFVYLAKRRVAICRKPQYIERSSVFFFCIKFEICDNNNNNQYTHMFYYYYFEVDTNLGIFSRGFCWYI